MSDTDRIRERLQAGDSVCVLDYDGSGPIVDDGKPIKRVAARIHELAQELPVERIGTRNQCAVYALNRAPTYSGLRIEIVNATPEWLDAALSII